MGEVLRKDYFVATRRLRAALLTSSALTLAWMLAATGPARAQDATWQTNPGSGNFYDPVNWNPVSLPTGTATFGASNTTALTLGSSGTFGGWTFNAGASNYTFTIAAARSQDFRNSSTAGSANITNNGALNFFETSTAGNAAITNNAGGTVDFSGSTGPAGDNKISAGSIAGAGNYILGSNELTVGFNHLSIEVSGVISGSGSLVKTGTGTLTLSGNNTYTGGTTVNGAGTLQLGNSSGGVGAIQGAVTIDFGTVQAVNADTSGITTITINSGNLNFYNTNTAGSATITNNGIVHFADASTAGNATITQNGNTGSYFLFTDDSTAGNAAITNNGVMGFVDSSSAGSATITNTGVLTFSNTSTAGGSTIFNNSGTLSFNDTSTVGNATITNNSDLRFNNSSTAGSALAFIINNDDVQFNDTSTASSALILNNGYLGFTGTSNAGSATITNNSSGSMSFTGASSASNATITNIGTLSFWGTSTGGGATITNNAVQTFYQTSSAGSSTIYNNANLVFRDTSTAGNATITNNGDLAFHNTSTAGSSTIYNNSNLVFRASSSADNAAITNGSSLIFLDGSTAGNATIANNGTLSFIGNSTAGNAALINNVAGTVDFSGSAGLNNDFRLSAGSIAGAGNYLLGADRLTVGSNNLSTEVSGVISGSGSLVKTGTGTLNLAGINTYAGATTIDGGVLRVDGSIASSSGVTVHANGALMGTGTVSGTAIDSGGSLLGGNGTAGTSLAISGNLAFQSGAYFLVQVNPATASSVNVTGSATLGGATVNAVFAPGSYVAKQYTILTAGSVSGTFGSLVDTNLPSNFHTELSYDATHAYLNLILTFVAPPGSGLSGNQQNVGNAIINSFNANGGISLTYSGLTAAGLTQASGETAAGSQATTFQAMGQFMGLLTDPSGVGRETGASAPPAYADNAPAGAARDAYAMLAKAPPAKTFEQRWNVWAAGFGGSQTTDGNTAQGSNSATSRLFGTAAGAEYAFSPQTLAGFALAGGGTNFSVTGGGTGRSDLFQAGAYLRHNNGPSYISAALAYGWQGVTTDRTVTLAGVDRLRAEFNANAWSGRVEGGYRLIAPWIGGIGLTPYAAGQFTTFNLPAYAETVVSGSNAFALAYGARGVTDTRSELGLRADKSFAMANGVLTLRGRAAWAHDFNPDRFVGATFQALPGASFVVNGARAAADSALTTVSAEMRWLNGWSTAASFEGEFSNATRSYAGKGTVRYAW
ncbi:MAG: autotransporter domain-containing protein [Bradyrhizobium sp.]|uniref:autotransporter domain-containing protein n=1 Tax=Bradyrhizobium sp. TaxID=376 RepID=UPI002722325B|nr:autotransporter domain-containing protein [Bradyrhizobium sp.]MDO8396184.1 autotransporter domain-containing protein [Bradyrhizobium sp.]